MASIIKRNVILSPTDYDGVAQQKGIVTFEILGNEASGFLRCYNLENKNNLVFGVKVNEKMFKFKLNNGYDYLTFSLGNENNLQTAKISCVLVEVNSNNSKTILIGSTETTQIYSNEILNFLNEEKLGSEKGLEDKLYNQNKLDKQEFEIREFNNDEILKFKPIEKVNIEENNKAFNNSEDDIENEELINYIDDLSSENTCTNNCKNCMYKNYFYCKNNEEDILAKEKINVNSLSANQKVSENFNQKVNSQTAFYDSLSGQINSLISSNNHEEVLEDILPNSTFVRIEKENGSYLVLGVINNEEGNPEYLCYGHPAKDINDKPFNYDNHFSFFPTDVSNPTGEGYYLSYQSAQNGENVKVKLI